MPLEYKYLLYNHSKSINEAKYNNIDYVFDIKNPYATLTNAAHKTCYFVFSLHVISNLISLFQTICLMILSYGSIPKHLSFIMDGNRRFAKSINQPLKKGHELGSLTLLQILFFAKTIGVNHLSVYAFSIENFNRSKNEVDILMALLVEKLSELSQKCTNSTVADNIIFKGIQIKIVGDLSYLNDNMNQKIKEIESLTALKEKSLDVFTLYICCPYTSRNEIYHAVKKNVNLKLSDNYDYEISENSLENQMFLSHYTNNCELIIRTSGARRYSDYLMWQTHMNSSFIFSKTLWPDYGFHHFFIDLFKWGFYQSLCIWKKTNISRKQLSKWSIKNEFLAKKESCVSYFLSNTTVNRMVHPTLRVSRIFIKRNFKKSIDDLPKPPPAISITQRN
ncbi:hypothetical protein QEN19_002802 [Hanseniaspora menglaensis]